MIEIKPNALYTRADLAEMLGPAGVDVDHFIARVKPRKVFKMVWLGADILKAWEAAPAMAEREERPAALAPTGKGNRRGRRPAADLITLDEIS